MQITSQAKVKQIRQTTQFSCMAASLTSALYACGRNFTEDDVNSIMGASPMRGASWEEALATIQYFGCRGVLVVPATLNMIKKWTDRGIPVMIAWNPEDRPWSHASVVFDVDADENVHVMDPNIPDPEQTIRIVPKEVFYKKWSEKFSDSLIVRRPACAVMTEITPDGRQVTAASYLNDAHQRAADKIWKQKPKVGGYIRRQTWYSDIWAEIASVHPPDKDLPLGWIGYYVAPNSKTDKIIKTSDTAGYFREYSAKIPPDAGKIFTKEGVIRRGTYKKAAIRPRIRIQPQIWDKLFKEHGEKKWYTEEMKGKNVLTMEYYLKENERGWKHQKVISTRRLASDDTNPLCNIETPMDNNLCPKDKGKDAIRISDDDINKLGSRWTERRR